jgi:hypothetical protein
MMLGQTLELDSKMQAAVDELQGLIRQRHPEAQFRLGRDPEGSEAIHLTAVLDLDDTDLVVDEFIDRMMQLQIDDELPIFVIPVRTPERERALLEAARARRGATLTATRPNSLSPRSSPDVT